MPQAQVEIRDILAHLLSGRALEEQTAQQVFELILTGHVNDAQLGAMLGFIAARPGGPTVDEIVAGVRVMRRHVTPVPTAAAIHLARDRTGFEPVVIDTCGTGGAPKTFNVSTVAAIVAAAAGKGRVLVAKHGGRSRTGRGSAEVLEKLGVNVNAPPETQAVCLGEIGICFSFAQQHHPAMKHAAVARKSLGFPTLFNLIGPLSNPAGATRQLVGTYSVEAAEKLAAALARLGSIRAMIVTSRDGMDELTHTSPNDLFEVIGGAVRITTLDTRDMGMSKCELSALVVSTLDDAASIFMDVLNGRPGAARQIVELNAGAAIVVAGAADDLREGMRQARAAIDDGAAKRTFTRLIELTRH
ncbi:MAG: anthranilate phosphoribosyltransferase [Pyrinomonadaceae bacterium]|nr:anthranilate phosphoribosyltransferase [Phycisphaerales bacterium]